MRPETEGIGRLERLAPLGWQSTGVVRLELVELFTDTHQAQVWMGEGQRQKLQAGALVEHAKREGVLLVKAADETVTRFICDNRRELRPRPGEFLGWLAGRWYATCAAWARGMALEAFQASMEARQAKHGTAANVRPREGR